MSHKLRPVLPPCFRLWMFLFLPGESVFCRNCLLCQVDAITTRHKTFCNISVFFVTMKKEESSTSMCLSLFYLSVRPRQREMSWAEEDWTVGLSGRVLQKVKELQVLQERLSRENKQKQLQLDNIHTSLEKQTVKVWWPCEFIAVNDMLLFKWPSMSNEWYILGS